MTAGEMSAVYIRLSGKAFLNLTRKLEDISKQASEIFKGEMTRAEETSDAKAPR